MVHARGGLLRRAVAVATVAIVDEMEDLRMRKLVSAAVLGALLAMLTGATFAQTAPKGPQDCKAGEHWDQASKSCKK